MLPRKRSVHMRVVRSRRTRLYAAVDASIALFHARGTKRWVNGCRQSRLGYIVSKQEVTLRQWKDSCGFAGQKFAIGEDFVGFGVHRDFWGGVVPFQIFFAKSPAAFD